jgi:RNA polymerase sigma-70 factor, ECF subfamily
MNERELVEMILAGNVEAFEPLVVPYRRLLLSLASRLTGNMEDAGEAAQEALLRAFRYLRKYDPERSFRNWLLGILVNEARKIRAARKPGTAEPRQNPEGGEPASNEISPDERYARNEIRTQLMECLDVLSPLEKEVFLLRDVEEIPVRETAGILGTSSISIRVHLSRARRKMREAILERYPHLGKEGR